jgi:hypothetical protein
LNRDMRRSESPEGYRTTAAALPMWTRNCPHDKVVIRRFFSNVMKLRFKYEAKNAESKRN